jgi:hypothetical protein
MNIENDNARQWTKVSGYNNLVIFEQIPKTNTVKVSVTKYNVPYQSIDTRDKK